MSQLLQYKINSWDQLSQCRSNNSPDLRIRVSKYVQNQDIEGTKIEVTHPTYGTLFALTILPRGDLITNIEKDNLDTIHHDQLLNELKRYGFYVLYEESEYLPSGQVRLLKTLQGLRFDKLRLFVVHDLSDQWEDTLRVTAFNLIDHQDWLNASYSPSKKEWETAILDGTAFNVSGLDEAKKYHWDFLYNNIEDIDKIILRNEEHEDESK